MRARSLVVVALVISATRASAQGASADSTQPADAPSSGWIVGASLGVPGHRKEWTPDLFTLGVTFTGARPNHLVPDVAIGTMPYALAFGVVPIGIRGGVGLPLAIAPHLLLIPSGGVSVIAVGSPGGGGGVGGLNYGVSAIAHLQHIGLRAGVTWHYLTSTDSPFWLAEVGIVHVPLP